MACPTCAAAQLELRGPLRWSRLTLPAVLPGLGSYLAQAITEGRNDQMLLALGALLLVVVGLHLLVWSPLETWVERFHLEESGDRPRTPRIGRLLSRSRIVRFVSRSFVIPVGQQVLLTAGRLLTLPERLAPLVGALAGLTGVGLLGWGAWRFYELLGARPLSPEARDIPLSLALGLLRVGRGDVQ